LPVNPGWRIVPAMHGPSVSAVSVLLFTLTAFVLFGAARSWFKLSGMMRPGEIFPTHSFQAAGRLTAAALVMVGLAAAWLALVAVPW
jgi:hypothetical protein